MYVTESLGCTEEISNIANQLQFKIFFFKYAGFSKRN